MNRNNSNNPFRKNGFNTYKKKDEPIDKESEWGVVKFNPVARNAMVQQATPWSSFKNDLIKQQQDQEHESNITNVNSKDILKKREENYRKNLIESKRKQPTKWEKFSDTEEGAPGSSSSRAKKTATTQGRFQAIPSKMNLDSIKKKDFDSKMLTSNQNNFLKKVITKKMTIPKKGSLHYAIEDMKINGVVRDRSSTAGNKKMYKKKFKNKK